MTQKRLREYSSGSRTVQYLDVPYLDVLYATAHRCPKKKWQNNPIIGNTSLQDLLNHAKYDLLTIAGRSPKLPKSTCDL
jgi:hypothetical protein